jgi:membrane associated rhomboid family serine protease
MVGMSVPGQHEPPLPADVLRWVGEAAPGLWYLADVPIERRDAVRAVVWELVRNEQLEVGDWVAGRGQGFRLLRPLEPPPSPEPTYDPEAIRRPLLSPRPSIVTPLLVVVHVVWFVAGGLVAAKSRAATDFLAGTNHPIIDPILRQTGAVSASTLLRGEWWRLLTSGFVHVGLVHLFGNMVILSLLGSLAEAVWGRRRFLLIYLCGGLAGSVTAMAVSPLGGGGELVYGTASGGLWGVTAAVLAWMARNLKDAPPLNAADLVRRVAVVGVMNLLVSFAQGVSVAGMVGGAAAGLAVAVCLARLSKGQRVPAAAAGLVLTAVGFVGLLTAAVQLSHDWQTVRERVVRPAAPPTVARAADDCPPPP